MLFQDYFTPFKTLEVGEITAHYSHLTPHLPFAIDDYLLTAMNKRDIPYRLILHTWPTDPEIILGMQDTRLPSLPTALEWLKQNTPYQVVVRPAGGLAVISEPGVVNYTLLMLPSKKRPTIDEAYQLMVDLFQTLLKPFGQILTPGEVTHSYCPGKFDVSLNGKKIAGIAQRRIGQAIGIYIYLSLNGDQTFRGQTVQTFYKLGRSDQVENSPYPQVFPDSMSNLGDTIPSLAQSDAVTEGLLSILDKEVNHTITSIDLNSLSKEGIQTQLSRMNKRNERLFPERL